MKRERQKMLLFKKKNIYITSVEPTHLRIFATPCQSGQSATQQMVHKTQIQATQRFESEGVEKELENSQTILTSEAH